MTRKIIACKTVKGPNRSLSGRVQVGRVYKPGDEIPADLTDKQRMQILFDEGVLRYEGQEAHQPEPESKIPLGTAKEDGPPLSMKSGDNDDNVDVQLNAIKADQARRTARGEKVGAELDAEMRAKEDAAAAAAVEEDAEEAIEVVGGAEMRALAAEEAEMRALAAEEAEMRALDEQHEQLDDAQDEQRTVEVKAQTGEILDSGEHEEDGDEIRVSE
jgi:hypothetical protein